MPATVLTALLTYYRRCVRALQQRARSPNENAPILPAVADTPLAEAANLPPALCAGLAPKPLLGGLSFALADLLADIATVGQALAAAKGLRFEVHQEFRATDRIESDPQHLRQIVLSVVAHTITRTGEGHVALTVRGPADAAQPLLISIQSSRPALSAEAQRTFFASLGPEAHPAAPETYLSLFTARALVRMLEGEVGISAHIPGRYDILIPVLLQDVSDVMAEAPAGSPPASIQDVYAQHRASVPPRRLLLVVASQFTYLQSMFEQAGHDCLVVGSADAALESLNQEEFDVVIVDLPLPQTSAIHLLKLTRFTTAGRARSLPSIVLTNETAESNSRQAYLDAGAWVCLQKPLSAHELLNTLRSVHARATGDTAHEGADHAITASSLDDGAPYLPPFIIFESLRDGFHYLGEVQDAGHRGDWSIVHQRVRAMRGVACMLGAIRVAEQCRQILELSQPELDAQWPSCFVELTARLDEASRTLSSQQ